MYETVASSAGNSSWYFRQQIRAAKLGVSGAEPGGPKAPSESASEARRELGPEAEEKVKGVACPHKMTICTDFAHVICT